MADDEGPPTRRTHPGPIRAPRPRAFGVDIPPQIPDLDVTRPSPEEPARNDIRGGRKAHVPPTWPEPQVTEPARKETPGSMPAVSVADPLLVTSKGFRLKLTWEQARGWILGLAAITSVCGGYLVGLKLAAWQMARLETKQDALEKKYSKLDATVTTLAEALTGQSDTNREAVEKLTREVRAARAELDKRLPK